MPYTEISRCRVSGSTNLVPVLDLGEQHLTGVFPHDPAAAITRGPLTLVFCPESGLLQLRQSYALDEMYGENYGYRSGLNASMVAHLRQKVAKLRALVPLAPGDVVLDIGSNDGTLLGAYPEGAARLIGIDPTGAKFRQYYPPHVALVPDFFSADAFRSMFPNERAKVVTSISMFYDLESPMSFVQQIADILADDGVWHFEQSYMPLMLRTTSYDTVCHEHLEYYSLAPVMWMLDRAGLEIVDVELNDVNGGSFAVTAARRGGPYPVNRAALDALLAEEARLGLDTLAPYEDFRRRVERHRDDLVRTVRELRGAGKRIVGYGASTKGNVLLQYCGFTPDDIECIAEVNPDKYGAYTPGTLIPIVPEADAKARRPDYMLVLPWHFREHIVRREGEYLASGGKLLFPLPEIEVVG